jgi:hypothetical protein
VIFWILLAAAIVVAIVLHLVFSYEWWGIFGWGAVSLIVGAVLFGVAVLITDASIREHYDGPLEPAAHTEQFDLAALSTEATVEGRRYFLSGGYIEGSRQISFVLDHGDYLTVGSNPAGASEIWEDEEENPYVVVYDYYVNVWWLAPTGWWEWDLWHDGHEFHVPAGSVISDYSVDLKG